MALPGGAALLGAGVVALQYLGTGQRPLPSTLILLLGVLTALAPLQIALPVAVVLSCFQATIGDFFGPPGQYWKEAFVAVLVARALHARRPRAVEVAVAAATILVFVGYLVAGTPVVAIGWAAKILLFSLLAGWAVARLRPGPAEWRATYYGLALATGANVVLGIWQRVEGLEGLSRLGLPYGERIRQSLSGQIRAFGGFTSEAPFSYALVLATLAWLAFLVSERDLRRLAIRTAWVPVVALAGIVLSLDRIALVGLTAAVIGVALRHVGRGAAAALSGLAAIAVGGVLLVAGPARSSFLEGFTFSSRSADTRTALWREYARALTPFGAGPASAGAAYDRAFHRRPPLIVYGPGWYPPEHEPGAKEFRWMATRSVLTVEWPTRSHSTMAITFGAISLGAARSLDVQVAGRQGARLRIPTDGSREVRFVVPAGRGPTVVRLAVRPGARVAGTIRPADPRRLSIRVFDLDARGLGAQTEAERIYARVQNRHAGAPLAGASAGVVDNQYLSWLFQYGFLLGAVICLAFLGVLLRPLGASGTAPLPFAMQLWGLFVVVGALAVNIWEEFPIDFLVALGLGQLYGGLLTSRSRAGRLLARGGGRDSL